MNRGNFFRRMLLILFTVSIMLFVAVAGATVKLYTATDEDYANEVESQEIAKLRARDKAIKKATKQAGVVLLAYSKSINSELTDDEVTAITSNAWQLVGEPKYTRTLKRISDNTTIILWKATVEVNVDDSEIQSWIKRDDKEKFNIVEQTREAQKASEENDKKIEDLREQYNRATSQAERDSIIKQLNDTDREFLANQKFEEGNRLFFAKYHTDAIKLYSEAIQLNPNNGSYYSNRGASYTILMKYNQAIQDYEKSIELNPNFATYNNLGVTYDSLGQSERAIQNYNAAIQLNPKDADSYMNRGNAYYYLKQYERAIQDLDKAIALSPNKARSYYNRGVVYLKGLKQYKRAIQDFDKVIVLNPNDKSAYNNRGTAYNDLGQYERAIQDYNKAIELNPNDADTYNNRGVAYQGLQQYERAIQDYDKAIQLSPRFALAWNNRGGAYYLLKQYEQALKNFEKAYELNPNDKVAKNNIEVLRETLGK